MQQRLKIDDRLHEVDMSTREGGGLQIVVDGAARVVESLGSANGHHRVAIDGRHEDIFVARCADGTWVSCRGVTRLVVDADREPRRAAAGSGASARVVTPATPGVVVGLLVEEGADVTAGQGLVVVSAMKMETTLVAAHSGRVAAINTEVGASVKPGDILVEIKAEE